MSEAASARLDLAQTRALLSAAAQAVIAQKEQLTKADQDIGDGDHGLGMARGFTAFNEAAAHDVANIQELFHGCGRALMMASGGASGVVFGVLFQAAGKSVKPDIFDAEALVLALEGGLRAVQHRGKAAVGDKTMVDALAPAAQAARHAWDSGGGIVQVADAAAHAAQAGAAATRHLVARVGKAKALGERSVGFVDPGALTFSILLDAIAATLGDRRRQP